MQATNSYQKKAWYFHPEDWNIASRGQYSVEEIRDTFGSQSPKNLANASLTIVLGRGIARKTGYVLLWFLVIDKK